jgi:hypothetical protein
MSTEIWLALAVLSSFAALPVLRAVSPVLGRCWLFVLAHVALSILFFTHAQSLVLKVFVGCCAAWAVLFAIRDLWKQRYVDRDPLVVVRRRLWAPGKPVEIMLESVPWSQVVRQGLERHKSRRFYLQTLMLALLMIFPYAIIVGLRFHGLHLKHQTLSLWSSTVSSYCYMLSQQKRSLPPSNVEVRNRKHLWTPGQEVVVLPASLNTNVEHRDGKRLWFPANPRVE